MERNGRQYIFYVKSLLLLAALVTMAWNPMSVGVASSETTQGRMISELSQPESILSAVYANYIMLEIDEGKWLDAESNGVNLNLNVDDGYTSVGFPFDFYYYDTTFTTVYISSNGYLSFTDTSPNDYSNDPFPSTDSDNSFCVAPLWDDLIAQNNVYAWSTTEFVAIQYSGIVLYPGSPVAGTFEVVFFENGTIDFNYLEVLNTNSATIGLNYGDGIYYNSYPDVSLLGVTTFTLEFVFEIIGSELRVDLESPSFVQPYETTIINASVYNMGSNDEEDVELCIFLDGTPVYCTSIPSLISGDNSSISYEWIPTIDGFYNFTAYVEPVPDEITLANNQITKLVSVYSGLPYALFRDSLHLAAESTTTILSEYGIPFDILTSADMGFVDLSNYAKVIIASYQYQTFMDRVYANMSWFEDYVAGGGILEFHAFPYGTWINNTLPCGVEYVNSMNEVLSIKQPSNPMMTTPHVMTDSEISNWNPTVYGYLDNIPETAEVVIENQQGDPVLVEFNYHAGSVIISTQILEFGYFFYDCRLLENILLYSPEKYEHDVAIDLDAPSDVFPGTEVSLNIKVLNTGSSIETDLQFGLRINGLVTYSDTIPVLENGSIYEVSIPWVEYMSGTYEVVAFVEEIPGEIHTYENEVVQLILLHSRTNVVLWDQGHNSWSMDIDYYVYVDELEEAGYIIETTIQPLNDINLAMYSALVLGCPSIPYTIEEVDAIEDYVMNGGGLLTFTQGYGYLNNITAFAGIEWLMVSGWVCNSTEIAVHEVTEGVSTIFLYAPWMILNVTEPASVLVNDTALNPLVAASEIGLGRVVAIGDPGVLYSNPGFELILMQDNLRLGINIIDWLTENSYYNIITDTQQDLEVVTYMDSVVVTCEVTDSYGIDTVEVPYRIDGGAWQHITMTHVSGNEYLGTIPAQSWECCVEYVICSCNLLGLIGVDNNNGSYYSYTVTDPIIPEVEITSPLDEGTVSGTVSIVVIANDPGSGIDRVEFYVDGALAYTDSTAPYGLDWDSTGVADGSHELSVVAYDGAGNDADDSISVTIDNVVTTITTTTTTTNTTGTGTISEGTIMFIVMILGGAAVVIVVIVIIMKRK